MHFDRYVTGLMILVAVTVLLLGFPAYVHFVAMRIPGVVLPSQLETIGFVEARLSLAFAVFMAILVIIFAALHWREATSYKGASALILALAILTTGPMWYYRANIVEHRVTDGEISRDRTIAQLNAALDSTNVHIAQLDQTVAELQANLAAAGEETAKLQAATAGLYPYRYRSQSELVAAKVSIKPRNNPLVNDKQEIRKIKKHAASMTGMWASLTPFAQRYHHFNDRRDLAIGAMLVVGAFYDYGNPYPNDEKSGCVSINQNTGFHSIGDLTFEAMKKSDIGCCTDYTLMLISFLRYLDYDVNAIITSGHQTTQVIIDGRKHLVDANTLVFADDYFSDGKTTLLYFSPYPGSRIQQFQQYEIDSLAFGLEGFGPDDWTVYNPIDHEKLFDAEFLIDGTGTVSSVK